MTLKGVNLESDVFLVCLTHALSTEREEVMGLLMGEVDEERVLHLSAVTILRRSDKQPDRVEISPEQQTDASIKAEHLAKELKRPIRVVGWYHSHPHITVWPSHVDVRTQANYQQMDNGFVGLIFSVFNEDKATKALWTGRKYLCFIQKDIEIFPQEQPYTLRDIIKKATHHRGHTLDWVMTQDINWVKDLKNKVSEIRRKLAASTQLSPHFELFSGAGFSEFEPVTFERVEVPLHIVPSYSISHACLGSLVDLPKILLQEEDEAYSSVSEGERQDLLTRVHNASVYTKSVCHVMEMVSGPLLHNLECRLAANQARIQQLKQEKLWLSERLQAYQEKKLLPV